jgi:hypothetical protein
MLHKLGGQIRQVRTLAALGGAAVLAVGMAQGHRQRYAICVNY